MVADPIAGLLAPRLGLFTGKGGVGKSTLVAALALRAAAEGRRPLVVELGHRATMAGLFGTEVGFLPTEAHPSGVWACNLEADAAVRDYVVRHLPLGSITGRVLDHGGLRRFFRAAPAVYEVAVLARLQVLIAEGFDPILVDLDATGHATMMLETPEVFADLDPDGPLRQHLDAAAATLAGDEARLHLVTLPGELPSRETLELYRGLERRGRVQLGEVVVNRLPPWPGDAIPAAPDHPAAHRLAVRRIHRQRTQWASVRDLAAQLPRPPIHLPERPLGGAEDLLSLLSEARADPVGPVPASEPLPPPRTDGVPAALANAVYRGRHLVVCVGPGGVGKTTTAAALAVAASADRRVALLTIDPARRLADALGVSVLGDAMVPVEGAPGSLHAAMLDTKASFDALVARLAPDPERLAVIVDNGVYQAFSRTLARSHAYVAMERLHDLLADDRFDLVILDSPPTRSALDILDAPRRLQAFLEDGALNAFLGDGLVGRGVRRTGAMAAQLLGALVGRELVQQLLGFFEAFLPLREGFAERAEATGAALTSSSTSFVLVTAPDEAHLRDAFFFRSGLAERGLAIDALLVNRAFVVETPDEVPDDPILREAVLEAQAVGAESRRLLDAFRDPDDPTFILPRLDEEPTDLPALLALLGAARVVGTPSTG